VIELYQAEWCPSSRRVRQLLTELGIDFVARQVPVEHDERTGLAALAGVSTIPVLVPDDSPPVAGEEAIRCYLERRYPLPAGARAHRHKALSMRSRELREAGCIEGMPLAS
jgi:glutathione S-transferase